MLLLYYIFKIYHYIRFESNNNVYNIVKAIIMSIIQFLFSYLVICDPNPLFYLFTFYLPFENFFRAIFLFMFHSYVMAKFDETNNCKENQLIPSFTPNNEVQIWNSDNINNGIKYEFFLSDLFYYLKFSKKRLGIFIASLITIKILIYYYNAKLWLYFNEKESILPISMAKNTKYYITACIVNMEPIIVDYLIEMVKLINY